MIIENKLNILYSQLPYITSQFTTPITLMYLSYYPMINPSIRFIANPPATNISSFINIGDFINSVDMRNCNDVDFMLFTLTINNVDLKSRDFVLAFTKKICQYTPAVFIDVHNEFRIKNNFDITILSQNLLCEAIASKSIAMIEYFLKDLKFRIRIDAEEILAKALTSHQEQKNTEINKITKAVLDNYTDNLNVVLLFLLICRYDTQCYVIHSMLKNKYYSFPEKYDEQFIMSVLGEIRHEHSANYLCTYLHHKYGDKLIKTFKNLVSTNRLNVQPFSFYTGGGAAPITPVG